MKKFFSTQSVLWICVAAAFFLTPQVVAVAHKAHEMTCNKTAVNAMAADIQSMPDGDAKAAATKEMGMAKKMMREKDMESCGAHMQSAIKAMEE